MKKSIKINKDIFYLQLKDINTKIVCESCKQPIYTSFYSKNITFSPNKGYCKQCISAMRNLYEQQLEKEQTMFSEKETLYLGLSHPCGKNIGDFTEISAIFNEISRKCSYVIYCCNKCHKYFIPEKNRNSKIENLSKYHLVYYATGAKCKPTTKKPKRPKRLYKGKKVKINRPVPSYIKQALFHLYQGGGCSGK